MDDDNNDSSKANDIIENDDNATGNDIIENDNTNSNNDVAMDTNDDNTNTNDDDNTDNIGKRKRDDDDDNNNDDDIFGDDDDDDDNEVAGNYDDDDEDGDDDDTGDGGDNKKKIIKHKKKKSKVSGKEYFDEEANEEESDNEKVGRDSDDDDDDDDEDDYQFDDGFVVRDAEDSINEDSDDETQRKKKTLKRLKKQKAAAVLDEDDLLLIQDNAGDNDDRRQENDDEKSEEEETEIVAQRVRANNRDDDEDSDLGGFIIDEDDVGPDAQRFKQAKVPFSGEDDNDNERLKDAEDIFGVGFDELDFDDGFDEEGEENLEDRAATKSAQAKEALRAKYDRITLVENFCTDSDEVIRQTDLPERMQPYFKLLTDRGDDERKIEAGWIAQKLCEKMNVSIMESSSYEDSIVTVLKYIQVDHFEVPFIWAYRKPSIDKLTRKNLWYIFSMDEKWEKIKALKGKILKFIETIKEAASAELDDTELIDVRDKLRREVKNAESNVEEETERERNEENENFDFDRSQLDEALRSLKEFKAELSDVENRIDAARRRKAVQLVYDKNGAETVLSLFHSDRYISQIEYTNDEVYLKDILKYLDMLVKGAETKNKTIVNDDDDDDKDDEDDEDGDKVKGMSSLRISGRRTIASGKDHYRKYCRIERLREFAEYFVIPVSEFGDSMRHGFKSEPPPTPPQTALELAAQFVDGSLLKNEKAVLKAVTAIIASELSAEPSVRDAIRAQYKRNVYISTRPTPKGLTVITPFSPLFGIHYLNEKPLHEFLEKDRTLFIRLSDAEKNGLISISFVLPKLNDGTNDMGPFLFNSNFIPNFSLTVAPDADPYPHSRLTWDNLRTDIVQSCLEDYLLPSLEEEVKRELMREGRETLIEEAADNFAQMLTYGPYRDTDNPIESMKALLRSCPDRPDRVSIASIYMSSSDRDAVYFALIDKDGMLRAHEICPASISNQKREKVTDWLVKHRPQVVVLNASAGQSSKAMAKLIDEQINRDVEAKIRLTARLKREKREIEDNDYGRHIDEDDEFIDYRAKTVIVKDEIAKIFRESKRSKKMFPELHSGFHAAVCMARFVREPLAEYCNIWTSSSASEVFGYEALYLDVHPQKHLLEGVRRQLLNALEQVLVDAVCDVGVDINLAASNDHLFAMLGFVAGLGLRKADNLRQSIRRSKMVYSRNELIKRKLLSPTIWTNATAFLYIRDNVNQDKQLNLLDNTRIHPECYTQFEIVQKICGNALDIDSWAPEEVNDIVERQMHASRRDLENKMKKHPEWINLWLEGRPIPGVTPYRERTRDKDGHEKIAEKSCELKDGMAMLMLDDYIIELSDPQEKELWASAPQIKEEIRYPCLDLRQSTRTPTNEEMFKIITGETDNSLYIGQKVGVEILEIRDIYNRNNNTTRRLAQCKTDSNIRGTISEYEIIDDKIDPIRFNMNDHLQEGMSVMAVIIGVQKDRFSVELSIKPSYLKKTEDWWLANRYEFRGSDYSNMPKSCIKWWRDCGKNPERLFDKFFNEKDAIRDYRKAEEADSKKYEPKTTTTTTTTSSSKSSGKSRQPYRRAIHHPLFKNIDFRDAEEFLRASGKGAGEVIIRPSSKGLDRLAITWAFQDSMYKHIDVEERGKQQGNIGIGTELRIKEDDLRDEVYSDLDEIAARYIMAMNDFVKTAIANKHYFSSSVLEGEQYLMNQSAKNPNTIPYILRLEPNKPGYFCLSWFIKESSNPIKKELIQVRPGGYMYRKVVYPSLSEVFSRFKADQSALRSGQLPQPTSRQNPPVQTQRRSRFTQNQNQPPPPPPPSYQQPPVQSYQDPLQGYQDPYYQNYQMPPMHY